MAKLNISTKKTGDLLTATEFNAVVDAINGNASDIGSLQTEDSNIKKSVTQVQETQNTQGQTIKDLQSKTTELDGKAVKMVVISQDAYDALVSAGTVDSETYYNVLEE